jgi:LysM repeat protein
MNQLNPPHRKDAVVRQNQMNNPSPLNPESPVTEPKNQSRVRVRTAVTLVFAANFIALMALLIIGFGCRKPADQEVPPAETNTMTMPTFDTNMVPDISTNAPGTNATVYVPPVVEPVVPPVVVPSATEYAIVKGDYFEKIAKDHGISTKALVAANATVDPKKLKIGQKIQIPAAAAAPAVGSSVSAPVEATAPSEQSHKVKSGDTLTTIAKHYGVSVKALRSANSLTTDKIKVGDKLKIPAKVSAPVAAPVVPEVAAPEPAPAPAPAATTPKAL